MNDPSSIWRYPTWLWRLGWLVFSLWLVIALLFVTRWWLMKRAHERLQNTDQVGLNLPGGMANRGAGLGASPGGLSESQTSKGTPVRELPLIGPSLNQEGSEAGSLNRAREEIGQLLKGLKESRHDGVISFRELLRHGGVEGAEAMTEEQAAAEFLRRAGKVEDVLQKWGKALAMGPWIFENSDRPWLNFSVVAQRMLGALVEASWRVGDGISASRYWESMRLGVERIGDSPDMMAALFQMNLRREIYTTMGAGFSLEAWSDAQVSGLSNALTEAPALEVMRGALEGEKRAVTWLYDQGAFNSAVALAYNQNGTPTHSSLVMASVVDSLSTDQQKADNVAFLHHAIDRSLDRFNPETGMVDVAATEGTALSRAESASLSWFDRYYYLYASPFEKNYSRVPAESVIRAQTEYDQAHLAIALEQHHRQSGQYPESLEAVGPRFQNGLPLDVATGEAYGYRLLPAGGYQLWGRGVDRRDDGGIPQQDVVWIRQSGTPD